VVTQLILQSELEENKMNIEVNNKRSYLGKDIKAWCMSETEDTNALEIKRKYYSDDVEFKPSDKVYYFVDYVSATESCKECGSLNMCGCRLYRDLEKSPRKEKRKVQDKVAHDDYWAEKFYNDYL
jgi:hypothetical protein